MPETTLKKRLWHWRFHMSFVKFCRAPFKEHLQAAASAAITKKSTKWNIKKPVFF